MRPLQFKDTLNPLQPGWNPSTISQVAPKAGQPFSNLDLPYGLFKDGVYGSPSVHVHASLRALNPLLDGREVVFDVLDFDPDGFAPADEVQQARVDRLVIPVSSGGTFLILGQVDTESSVNNAAQSITITVNGTIGIGRARIQQQGTLGSSFNAVALWRLNEGDYVQLQYNDEAPNANAFLTVLEPGTPSLSLLRIGG